MYRVILDTDPGIDDALAILLALASPELHLEAITTVSGNVNIDLTTQNALAIVELAGQGDIPVARGSREPLRGLPIDATHIHGYNGLGDVVLPHAQAREIALAAPELIIEKVMNAPGEMTLVALGPLTNIAKALHAEPRIAQHVREIVMMGGAFWVPGNVTSEAEFNIFADPYAAQAVLHAAWPLRVVSLDVTRLTRLQHTQASLPSLPRNRVRSFISQMLHYYFNDANPARSATGFALHDPLCVGAVFRPDLITWEKAYVDVELVNASTLGKTSAKKGCVSSHVRVSVGVDAEQFIQLYLERMNMAYP